MNNIEQFVADALRTEPNYEGAIKRLQDTRTVRLLHVAMGLATEAGEFVDALKRHIYYGKNIDDTNLIEELGDSTWYERIGVAALEVKYADMLKRNVDKLRARFPDRFVESDALNRNLEAERAVLEGDQNTTDERIIDSRKTSYLFTNGWRCDLAGGPWRITDLAAANWPKAVLNRYVSRGGNIAFTQEEALTVQREIDWFKGL